MNAFEKELRKLNAPHPFRRWWSKNSYKVFRVILFPVWMFVIVRDKLHSKYVSRCEFSDEKAKRIMDKVLPRHVLMDEDGSFMLCRCSGEYDKTPDMFWGIDRKMSKRNRSYFRKFHSEFINYVFERYEIEGYVKYHSPSEEFIEAAKLEESFWEYKNKPGALYFKKIK